jgi:alkylhydroperoxidase family enzyme
MAKRLDYNQIACPETRPFRGVYGYLMQSSLPRVLVELVYLRISQINNCAARLFRRSAKELAASIWVWFQPRDLEILPK